MRPDRNASLLLCFALGGLADHGAAAFTASSDLSFPRAPIRSSTCTATASSSSQFARRQGRGGGVITAPLAALGKNSNNEDDIIDAIIEEEIAGAEIVPSDADGGRKRKRDVVRKVLRRLAALSLEDYKWRSSVFKNNEADRQVEESLARMMGEDAAYVRPMDASDEKRGPLGWAEKKFVTWLSSVIEEEGERAKRIANSDGELIRPIDLDTKGGPLADLERGAVNFIDSIRDSEKERCSTRTLRPKDLDESKRGPLGAAEAKAVSALEGIASAEKMRAEQSKLRGGEIVRPIDVPGPLGEVEKTVMEVMTAERQRAKERELNDGKVVRPKDATNPGPLGEAERQAIKAVDRLKEEETERLKNIKRVLQENRPMEADSESPLGVTERFSVGLLRGPQLAFKVIKRVRELMSSEQLDEKDAEVLRLSPSSPPFNDEDGEEEERRPKEKGGDK